ncbi:hypothetical protein ACWEP1_14070, partial [Streptomyces sp. NPDC004285]
MRHVIALSVTETGTRAALVGFDGSLVYVTRRVRGRAAVDPVARRAEELRALGRERFGAAAEAVGSLDSLGSLDSSGPLGSLDSSGC